MNKTLIESRDHARSCGARWQQHINRNMDDPCYKDEWYSEQCLHCCFYIPLTGAFIEDWGVCSNPDSKLDGSVRFEHDGCSQFKESESWWALTCPEEFEPPTS